MNIIFIVLLIILIIFLYKFVFKSKHLKLPNVYLVSGGVKTGKSMISVALAVKTYKRNKIITYIKNFIIVFLNLFKSKNNKIQKLPLPMLYSNIALRHVKHNKFTLDILLRRVRIPNKSVVLLDEVSLVADSMLYKDKRINNDLMLFVKLFGHYTHGGTLIVNTQSIADCHYAFKRCISSYLWIHSKIKFPFITLYNVRELVYSEDNASITNSIDKDVEEDTKPLYILNKYYKYYDCYCYSILTDDLNYYVNYDTKVLKKKDSLKTEEIVSLQDFIFDRKEKKSK